MELFNNTNKTLSLKQTTLHLMGSACVYVFVHVCLCVSQYVCECVWHMKGLS